MKANLKRKAITNLQIEDLLAKRNSLATIKKRFDLLESSAKAAEQELIRLIEDGAQVPGEYELQVREIERRYPHWKELYGSLATQVPSAPSTQEILANTSPSITKSLLIK